MSEAPIKRIRYFTGQFLEALDFQAEQAYHVVQRRRGLRALYAAGIVDGLAVSASADPTHIVVAAGAAVDAQGREIVVAADLPLTLPVPAAAAQSYLVSLRYAEQETDQQTPDSDVSDNTRIEERPEVDFTPDGTALDRTQSVVLARVTVGSDGRLRGAIDPSARQLADAHLPAALGVGTAQPTHGVHVVAAENLALFESTSDAAALRLATNRGIGNRAEIANRPDGRLALSTGGAADALNLTRDGRVGAGIATPVPNARLQVHGGALAVAQDATLTRADAAIHVCGSAGGYDRLLQMSPLGSSKPGLNLLASRSAASTEQWWSWGVSADDKWRIQKGTQMAGDGGLTLTASALGVRTASPTNALHVNATEGIRQNSLYLSGGPGGSSLSYNAYRNAAGSWAFPDPSRPALTMEIDDAGGKARWDLWTTPTSAKTSWTHRMRIDGETGHVGLATTVPAARLHVVGSALITDRSDAPAGMPGGYRLMVSGGDTRIAAPGQEQSLFGLDRLVGRNDLRFYVDDSGSSQVMHLGADGLQLTMANPAAATGFRNTLTPKNIPKAWALVRTGPGAGAAQAVVVDGFNVESVSAYAQGQGHALVTLKEALSGAMCIVGNVHRYDGRVLINFSYRNNGREIEVVAMRLDSVPLPGVGDVAVIKPLELGTQEYYFSFVVYGAQS